MLPTPKSFRFKSQYWLLVFLLFFVTTCQEQGLNADQPKEDPDAKPVLSSYIPITLQFLNADPTAESDLKIHPQEVRIEVYDSLNGLSSITGRKLGPRFRMVSSVGIVNLKLPKVFVTQAEEGRYSFTVSLKAPGFLGTNKTVILSDTLASYFPIYMVNNNENTKTPGIKVQTGTIPLGAEGRIEKELILGTSVLDENNDTLISAKVIIKEGTQLLNKNQTNTVNNVNSINYKLGLFDARFKTSLNAFPGNFFVTNARSSSGKSIANPAEPIFLNTFGHLKLNFFTEGSEGIEVGAFSQPAVVRFRIHDPSKELNSSDFDSIHLWHFNEASNLWVEETESTFEEDEGDVVEWVGPLVGLPDVVVSQSDIPCNTLIKINNNPGVFKTRFIQVSTPHSQPLLPNGNVINLKENSTYPLPIVVPNGAMVNLDIFETCSPVPATNIDTSGQFSACRTGQISVPDPPSPVACEELVVQIGCPNTGNCYLLDAVGFNFNIGSGIYNYFGSLTGGRILFDANKIANNNILNFLLWFDDNGNSNFCTLQNGSVCFSGQMCLLPDCQINNSGSSGVPNDLFINPIAQGAFNIVVCRESTQNGICAHRTRIKIDLQTNCETIFGQGVDMSTIGTEVNCMGNDCN
ncbi:MAG: hypothetical protein AAFO07_28370 [Bacteroidota bacterium]